MHGHSTASPNNVCDPGYFQLGAVPRLRLLGVPSASNCLALLESRSGFVFHDGNAAGAYVSDQPQVSLPILTNPTGFPFLIVGGDRSPARWCFVRGTTGEAGQLLWDGSQFSIEAAGEGDVVTRPCSAPLKSAVTLFGCVQTPNGPAIRRLNAIDARVLVGAVDGDGNQSVKCLANTDNLTHPLGKFSTLRFGTIQALNDDGTDTAGGLPNLPLTGPDAVTDARLCYYDGTAKKLFKVPPGYVRTRTDFEDEVFVHGSFTTQFTFADVALNYRTVQVAASFIVGSPDPAQPKKKRLTLNVKFDGDIRLTATNFDPGDPTAVSNAIYLHGYVGSVSPGIHTIIFEIKSQAGSGDSSTSTVVYAGSASVATSQMP